MDTAVMLDWCGTQKVRCPDCGDRLHVPHDYAVSAFRSRQPEAVLRWSEDVLHAHALQKPILHPTVLAPRHLLARPGCAHRRRR